MNKTISRLAAVTCAGIATAIIGSTALLVAPVSAAQGDAPLYRLYSPGAKDHFYTTSAAERDNAVARFGYKAEGLTGYVGEAAGNGRTALYRLYSARAGDHFYTTSAAERDNAVRQFAYRDEGVAGYVGVNATSDSQALLRSYSAGAGDHFYTTSNPEHNYAVSNLAYRAEGIMGYVFNSNAAPVNPGGNNGGNNGGNPNPTPTDPTKFDKARVSLTFDDGWKTIHTNGLPALASHGMKSTQYLNGEPIAGAWDDFMNYNDVKDFYAQGHELAWHTYSHADLTTLTSDQIDAELSLPSNFVAGLAAAGIPVTAPNFTNFATPYGAYNADNTSGLTPVSPEAAANANYVISKIMGKYSSHRSVDEGYNTKQNFSASNIVVQNIENTTTTAEVQSWLDQAKAQNAWLVFVYHDVYDEGDSSVDRDRTYDVTTAALNAQLDVIKNSQISVETVAEALAAIRAQMQ